MRRSKLVALVLAGAASLGLASAGWAAANNALPTPSLASIGLLGSNKAPPRRPAQPQTTQALQAPQGPKPQASSPLPSAPSAASSAARSLAQAALAASSGLPSSGLAPSASHSPAASASALAPESPAKVLERAATEAAEVPDAEPEPEPPAGPELLSTLKETWIYAAPSFKARKLGYLRAGAVVGRGEKPVSRGGCEGGWYSIAPKGFVCVGVSASLNLDHPIAEMAARRPDRKAGLPYSYAMSRFPTPPFYLKLPSVEEQRSVEPDLAKVLARSLLKPDEPLGDVPSGLLYGRIVPSLTPNHHGPGALYAGRAVPRSGFAMVSEFTYEGRRWGLTTDFFVVPLDRMRPIAASTFHGVELGDGGLPVVFSRSKGARYLKRDDKTGALADAGAIGFREGAQLTGKSLQGSLETRDGRWIRDNNLVRVDPPKEWPQFAQEGKKWIDVSILKQTLVAYEGQKPVYATLVSTGADGLGDPEKTHSTVRGMFLIHTKHVTVTMDSDEAEDRFDLRDVPYVQYFHEGYALHAAYWHDDFGKPRSHGCINLAPQDAAWLFAWTDPKVPEAWHAALSPKAGTVVYVHP